VLRGQIVPMPDPPASEDEPRVPIGEAAAGEDEESAPTGLPPEGRRRARTVDEDPETQETG
jgi:hypothetical protein